YLCPRRERPFRNTRPRHRTSAPLRTRRTDVDPGAGRLRSRRRCVSESCREISVAPELEALQSQRAAGCAVEDFRLHGPAAQDARWRAAEERIESDCCGQEACGFLTPHLADSADQHIDAERENQR